MKKKYLIEALAAFDDDDHIALGEEYMSYVPKIEKICGGSDSLMGYYCCMKPGHSGDCYSANKHVYFIPDER